MSFEKGPYIQAACFCDMVLRDDTGAFSLIRLIDTLNITAQGSSPPDTMPPMQKELTLAVMLKSGTARGRHTLKIVPELPNGSTLDAQEFTVHFEGEEKGYNIIIKLNFVFAFEGLYWFLIYLDDEGFTEIPIRVKYDRRVVIGAGTPNPK